MNLQVFVWDSPQEKIQVLKVMKRPKFGVAEETVFCFVYYELKSSMMPVFGFIWKKKV